MQLTPEDAFRDFGICPIALTKRAFPGCHHHRVEGGTVGLQAVQRELR